MCPEIQQVNPKHNSDYCSRRQVLNLHLYVLLSEIRFEPKVMQSIMLVTIFFPPFYEGDQHI